jgi:O-antigen/teichoic acid export membrane protein
MKNRRWSVVVGLWPVKTKIEMKTKTCQSASLSLFTDRQSLTADYPSSTGHRPPTTDHPDLRSKAARGGAVLIGSRFAIQVVSWLVTIQVARLLRPLDYAVTTAGMMVIGFCDLLADSGVGRALVRRESLERDDADQGFTLSLVLSAALYTVVLASAGVVAGSLRTPELTAFLRVVGLSLLLVPFRSVALALLEHRLEMGRQSAVAVVVGLFQSAVLITAASLGYGYWAYAAVALIGRSFESVCFVWLSGWRPRLRRLDGRARGLATFGLNVTGASLLWFAYSNADFAVVGRVSGPEALGFYALAFQFISIPVQRLTAAFNQVAYPVFCRLQGDPARVRAWYLRLAVLLVLFGAPALVGMALVAPDAFSLVLGPKWLPAVVPFRIMSLAGVVMVFAASIAPLLNALGRPDLNLRYTLACALIFPPAFLVAAEAAGVHGVCAVWAAVYPVIVFGNVELIRGVTGFGAVELLRCLGPVAVANALMAAAVLALQAAFPAAGASWPRLIGSILVGAAAYAGSVLLVAQDSVVNLRAVLGEFRGRSA